MTKTVKRDTSDAILQAMLEAKNHDDPCRLADHFQNYVKSEETTRKIVQAMKSYEGELLYQQSDNLGALKNQLKEIISVERPLQKDIIVRRGCELAKVISDDGRKIEVIEFIYYFGKNEKANELCPSDDGETTTKWCAEECFVVDLP